MRRRSTLKLQFGLFLSLTVLASTGGIAATLPDAAASHEEVVARVRAQAATAAFDMDDYIALLDATVGTLVDQNPGLGPDYPIWVLPSKVYPEMYSRDSFWTLAGYEQQDFLGDYVDIFARNAQGSAWVPPLAGEIPTFVRKNVAAPADGRRADESTLFWILGAKLTGKSVAGLPYLSAAHAWLKTLVTPAGFALVSHGWIDAWQPVNTPVVSANNQGLYAVALRALRDMGEPVDVGEIAAADAAYRSLIKDGYVHAYLGSDVVDVSSLMGEALALYLWDESILGADAVRGTVGKFAAVNYPDGVFLGYKCLANPDGSYLDPNDFWSIAERDPGNYQNGGSWLLYEALALYAAERHTPTGGLAGKSDPYSANFVGRLASEIRYERSSKEFICTGGTCGACTPTACICPGGLCGAGAFDLGRSGYGWNAFVKRLITARPGRPANAETL